ncbi:unnamed protein product [Cuscuta europaea]|uniref:Uncharacterized protein n=1 Tax=Cuscuta europaea TaxID=41803 RepID=A0A9P0ZZG8_CUSEU|nr:unnamed protein product [Cuscuta europaea]
MRWLDVTFVLGTVIQAHVKRIFCRGGCLRLKGAGPKALLTEGSYLPRAAGAEGLVFKPCSPVMPLLTEGSYLPRAAGAEGLVFKPCSLVMPLLTEGSYLPRAAVAEGLVFKPCSRVMHLLTEGSYLPRAAVAEGLVFKPCSPVMFLSSIPSLVAFGHGAEGTPLCIVGCLELHFSGLGPFGLVGPDCSRGSMWAGGPWAIYSINTVCIIG